MLEDDSRQSPVSRDSQSKPARGRPFKVSQGRPTPALPPQKSSGTERPRTQWRRPSQQDQTPDVRDGLTRVERIVLYVLHETQQELKGRNVPTAMLYGRVVEHVNISVDELQRILQRLIGIR